MRRIKYFLLLFLIIPFININALTLCDDSIFADPPQGFDNYVIFISSGSTYIASVSSTQSAYVNNTQTILFIGSGTVYRYKDYVNANGHMWISPGSSNSFSYDYSSILATTVDITLTSGGETSVIYAAGYNINCSFPEPEPDSIPQDFSLINTIASYINDFVVGLQNNNISIEITFISLIIFNFLVFLVCYIITHLE